MFITQKKSARYPTRISQDFTINLEEDVLYRAIARDGLEQKGFRMGDRFIILVGTLDDQPGFNFLTDDRLYEYFEPLLVGDDIILTQT